MSDVPLAKSNLKVAKPLATRAASPLASRPTLARAPQSPMPVCSAIFRFSTRVDSPSAGDSRRAPSAAVVAGRLAMQGLVAMMVCTAQVVVQEAPAWALSMVVHMVTLVTMAMVTVPDAVPYKAQHLVVAPPEEQNDRRDHGDFRQAAGDAGRRRRRSADGDRRIEDCAGERGARPERRAASGAGSDGNEPARARLHAEEGT